MGGLKAIIHHVKRLPELEDVLHSCYTWLICRVERAQKRFQTGNKLLELPFLDPWLRFGLCDLHFIITHIPTNILSLQHIRYAKRHACHLNSGCREKKKKRIKDPRSALLHKLVTESSVSLSGILMEFFRCASELRPSL